MPISLKHAYQSAVPDSGVTSLVQPSNWNAEHVLTLATSRLIGRTTAGTGAAEEISVGANLTLSAGTLAFNPANVSLTGDTVLGSAIGDSTTVPNQSELQYTTSAYPTDIPDLNLDFMNNDFLDPRIAFSRTSNATVTDRTGRITFAPNNLATYSEQFDNAAWSKLNATVTANSAPAPDGTLTADFFVETAVTGFHRLSQSFTPSTIGAFTHSVYAKAGARTWLVIQNDFGGNNTSRWFNLSNGTVGAQQGLGGISSTITPVGNGWYRCSLTTVTTTTASGSINIYPGSADGVYNYAGDGVSGIYVWGAQLEAVTYQTTPSTYVRTVASAYYGPRFDYDPVTLAPKGFLIEDTRTNLTTYSDAVNSWGSNVSVTVVPNATTSPDGTVNADKLSPDATGSGFYAQNNVSISGSVTYTASVYLKAAEISSGIFVYLGSGTLWPSSSTPYVTVNLATGTISLAFNVLSSSITNVGNGWYRVAFTQTSVGAGTSGIRVSPTAGVAGNGSNGIYVWGAQLETGPTATSYIPTAASSVARAADTASLTGTNFTSWFSASEGLFTSRFDVNGVDTSARRYIWSVNDAGNTRLAIRASDSAVNYPVAAIGTGSSVVSLFGAALSSSTPVNLSLAYGLTQALSQNGAAPATSSSASSVTGSGLFIGMGQGSNSQLNGHLQYIRYYARRLSDTIVRGSSAL